MKVRVEVTRRAGIADPQGTTVRRALGELGFEVGEVHFGRIIDLDVAAEDPDEARRLADDMCRRLLANPVIEDYSITVQP